MAAISEELESNDPTLNQIGDEAAEILAEALKENQTLIALNSSQNQIGDECAKMLEALQESKREIRKNAMILSKFSKSNKTKACPIIKVPPEILARIIKFTGHPAHKGRGKFSRNVLTSSCPGLHDYAENTENIPAAAKPRP